MGSAAALMPGTSSSALTSEAKASAAIAHRVVERTYAGAIARHHQALLARVPYGEGEVAVELRHAIGAALLVEVDDDLGVGAGLEGVSAGDEIGAQLEVVEDLAVEGDPDGAVLVAHRLAAAVDVDDAEARVRQADVAVDVESVAVRPAMRDRPDHAREQATALIGRNRQAVVSGYSTHVVSSRALRSLTQTFRR